jgi:hypothetical protein
MYYNSRTTWFLLNNNSNKPPSSHLHAGSHAGLCACIASSLRARKRRNTRTSKRGGDLPLLTFCFIVVLSIRRELLFPLIHTWSRAFSPLYHQSLISNRTSVLCFTRHGTVRSAPHYNPHRNTPSFLETGPTDHMKSQVVLTLF